MNIEDDLQLDFTRSPLVISDYASAQLEPKTEWHSETPLMGSKEHQKLLQAKQFGDLLLYESIMDLTAKNDLASDDDSQANET